MKILNFTRSIVLLISMTCLPAFAISGAYTLYRSSVLDSRMRLHIATFDAADGNDYNSDNCETAAKLFQQQEGVKVRFWCEKGNFQK